MPRIKKDPSQLRTHLLGFKATPAEVEVVRRVAQRLGVDMGDVLRLAFRKEYGAMIEGAEQAKP